MGAGPVGKDLLGKNHEVASVSWPGRAIAIAECGLKNKCPKKSEIHNSKSEMGRPVLFTQNPAKGGTLGRAGGLP